ncbi:MAG: L-aspartate oxidase, partial [Anaerolineae bacterium]
MYDFIIVGSGIAGLYTALLIAPQHRVLVVTKGSIDECNSRQAQGGVAAAIGVGDSPALHLQDTLAVGGGLCDAAAVGVLTREGPARVREMIELGVPFDTEDGAVALGREGGHSLHRILHAGGDATGANIEVTLSAAVRRSQISVWEHHLVTDLLVANGRVGGVRVVDRQTGRVQELESRCTILATGGGAQLFRFNTNPTVATADGVALAYRAGAVVADMEFFQFHPTALRLPGAPSFLISEAARGEGGLLRDGAGRRFMLDYHPSGELAGRDVVARAIRSEMVKSGSDHVYLDLTHLPASLVTTRFPSIYRTCLEYGLDITKQPIPVAPAAHYMMGGVRTNVWGQTSLPGLFACGECTCTGVHGANRLASNSLLEVLVFGRRIAEQALDPALGESTFSALVAGDLPAELEPANKPDATAVAPSREALQSLLWDKAGLVRTGEGLAEARALLRAWQSALSGPLQQDQAE